MRPPIEDGRIAPNSGGHSDPEARSYSGSSLLAVVISVLEAVDTPAIVVAAGGRIVSANSAAQELVGDLPTNALQEPFSLINNSEVGHSWIRRPIQGFGALDWQIATLRGTSTEPAKRRSVGALCRRWNLTPRQGEILGLVLQGMPTQGIAESLRLHTRTVELHLTAIFDKAGVNGRVALIATVIALSGPTK
jgi:DNA-binding CsgD family transcriptional regulator